jgi:urease accessory protein
LALQAPITITAIIMKRTAIMRTATITTKDAVQTEGSNSNGGDRLLALLQVTNAAFPTGAFTHSYGFETWLHDGTILKAADAEQRCTDWLRFNLATGDAAAVALAYRCCVFDKMEGVEAIDRQVGAIKLSRETRTASVMTGAALVASGKDIFDLPQISQLAEKIAAGECEGHHAIVYAALACGLGFSEKEAVTSFLWASFSSLVGVVQRLVPLGQTEAQRMVANAAALVEHCSEIARTRELRHLSSSFVTLDIASMRHERLQTRLCIS